jgi:hypothetical protein
MKMACLLFSVACSKGHIILLLYKQLWKTGSFLLITSFKLKLQMYKGAGNPVSIVTREQAERLWDYTLTSHKSNRFSSLPEHPDQFCGPPSLQFSD